MNLDLINSFEKKLCVAARFGYWDTALKAIKAGEDVNTHIEHAQGDTALHLAASQNKHPIMWDDYLLASKYLAGEGRSKLLRALLDAGANIEAKNDNGETPLARAVRGGSVDGVEFLIEAGADLEATNHWSKTPLHGAANDNNLEIVEALLKGGADVHAVDDAGRTALHHVFFHRFTDYSEKLAVTKLLLEAGADPDARDNDDQIPRCRFMPRGMEETIHEIESVLLAARLEKSLPQVEESTLEGAKVDMSRPFEERLAEMNKLGPMTKEREAERLAAYRQERAEKEGPDAKPMVMKSKCPGFGRF